MQLLFLDHLFSGDVLKAICWTLIHSLWQGSIAAALAGLVIIRTGKTSARLRYNLLGGVMVLFLAGSLITFCRQLSGTAHSEANFSSSASPDTNISLFNSASNDTPAAMPVNYINEAITYFDLHADLFVLIWAFLFFVNCIKLSTGLTNIYRMRNHKRFAIPKDWQLKVEDLSKMLGIQRPVSFIQSGIIKTPAAMGFFKPVILVPLGLISNLPASQVETILLHELAHIRRNDYIVNLFQRFAEAFFFFNPAFRWISSQLRQEREVCCDEIVFANTTDKGSYLEALVSFNEYSLGNQRYAMGLGTTRYYLLDRIKRMVTRENKKLNPVEKIILLVGLTVVTAFNFIAKKEPAVAKYSSIPQIKIPAKITRPPSPAIDPERLQNDRKITVSNKILKSDTLPLHAPAKEGLNPGKTKIDKTYFPPQQAKKAKPVTNARTAASRVQRYSRLSGIVNEPVVSEIETKSDIIDRPQVLRKKISIPRLSALAQQKRDIQRNIRLAEQKIAASKIEIDKRRWQLENDFSYIIRDEFKKLEGGDLQNKKTATREMTNLFNEQKSRTSDGKNEKIDIRGKIDFPNEVHIDNVINFELIEKGEVKAVQPKNLIKPPQKKNVYRL